MATSRISRGFHRLGLFLAGVPLLAGVGLSVVLALENANQAQRTHEQLRCAHEKIQQADKQLTGQTTGKTVGAEGATITLPPGFKITQKKKQEIPPKVMPWEMGAFDDLIPGAERSGMFDDLIPRKPPDTIANVIPSARSRTGAFDDLIPGAARSRTGAFDDPFWLLFAPDDELLYLKQIGCSTREYDTVSFGDARNPPQFDWLSVFAPPAAAGIAITFALTLGVYGLVRAIGWVIGGFASA